MAKRVPRPPGICSRTGPDHISCEAANQDNFRMPRRNRALPNWAIPALYAGAAVIAGLTLPRLEHALLPQIRAGISPGSATAIFSSVGSGMIALTGIVFALAILMVQFSATAYSPRLVMWLARDPVIWHSVGMFSATFLYSLSAIAWVDRGAGAPVPFFSGWLVIVLLLGSVAMFIALIDKLSLLQIRRMLAFTADHGRRVIEEHYPLLDAPPAIADLQSLAGREPTQTLRHVGSPESLQAIDVARLLALATQHRATIAVESLVGDTLVEGMVMLRVYSATGPIHEDALRSNFATGAERTFEQDPKYALRLLVDIAIRALSPAVNDPTSAVQALDQIEDLVRRLSLRRLEIGAYRDTEGSLRVVIAHPAWDDFLALAFDEIRYCGATSVQVMRRMRALLGDLMAFVPPERRAAVERHRKRLDATIARAFEDDMDKQEASIEDRQGLGVPRSDQPD
jgi:uncharacterized membrane protein